MLTHKTKNKFNVTLNDWVTNLFPLSKDKDWKAILQESSAPFTSESAKRLVGLLEGSLDIFENETQLAQYLPILLSSGTPEAALTQLHDFADAFCGLLASPSTVKARYSSCKAPGPYAGKALGI